MTTRPSAMTTEELAVWRGLQRAQVTIMRQVEGRLLAEHGMPLAAFDVLRLLGEAPGRQLRMNDLADRLLRSRSGLTRLTDRLQRDGLVTRHACESDARGLYAVLTPAGTARLDAAMPTYLGCVRELFLDRVSGRELASIAAMIAKLVDRDPGLSVRDPGTVRRPSDPRSPRKGAAAPSG